MGAVPPGLSLGGLAVLAWPPVTFASLAGLEAGLERRLDYCVKGRKAWGLVSVRDRGLAG